MRSLLQWIRFATLVLRAGLKRAFASHLTVDVPPSLHCLPATLAITSASTCLNQGPNDPHRVCGNSLVPRSRDHARVLQVHERECASTSVGIGIRIMPGYRNMLNEISRQAIDMWACGCIMAELFGRKPLFPGMLLNLFKEKHATWYHVHCN